MLLNPILIKNETEPWSIRHANGAIGIGGQSLGQHLVAQFQGEAAGWVMREFQPRPVRQRCGEMQVGEQAHAVAPGVGHHLQIGCLRHATHLAQLEDALGQQSIGLQNIEAAAIDQLFELVYAVIVLASGDLQRIELVPQSCEASVVVAIQGFLQPERAQLLQFPRNLDRALEPPELMAAATRFDAGLVGVHHYPNIPMRSPSFAQIASTTFRSSCGFSLWNRSFIAR